MPRPSLEGDDRSDGLEMEPQAAEDGEDVEASAEESSR
jgi:hypothetical protein